MSEAGVSGKTGGDRHGAVEVEPAVQLTDTEPHVDLRRLRAYRLERLCAQIVAHDCAAILLYDPINIRYATGMRNMAVWTAHNAVRYALVTAEGRVVLFDSQLVKYGLPQMESVSEARRATTWIYMNNGPRSEERAKAWALEIADLVETHGGGNKRLAIDKCEPMGTFFLAELGIQIVDGQALTEVARSIKSAEELTCMAHAVAVCEAAMANMHALARPGVTENVLWSALNKVNHDHGGEWIETRLLSSGGRTNPWFQECGGRMVRQGDLVSYDTDMIGPFGYCADISRSLFCGLGCPSDEQRRLYRLAWEQIQFNMDLIRPGMTFFELRDKAWPIPEEFLANRYGILAHGVGLADEFPCIYHREDPDFMHYDGVIEPGMTLCVESYIGSVGGHEGVKLEEQIVVTESGIERLSTFPYEESLLAREL